jgi:hypothetical protein
VVEARSKTKAKTKSETDAALLFCGSWLACDADNSVFQVHRGDAIAGKPAPTFGPCPLLILILPLLHTTQAGL